MQYGSGPSATRAVCQASLSIVRGESVGLLGESGCGKSTLARAICGLLPPHALLQGSIRFSDRELNAASENELRTIRGAQIAIVSQDPAQSLNPVLTIGAQIGEVLRSHVVCSRQERNGRVLETLRSVGFRDPASISRRYAHQLSGGERQRAAIAQAIVCRPSLLIADEATSKLDVTLKAELLELFATWRVQHGMALLLISHEPAVVAAAAERLLVMYAGEIVETGGTAAILRNPLHPYTQALVELARERAWIGEARPSRFSTIPGEPGPAPKSDCCCYEGRCNQRMAACAAHHPGVSHHAGREVQCLIYE